MIRCNVRQSNLNGRMSLYGANSTWFSCYSRHDFYFQPFNCLFHCDCLSPVNYHRNRFLSTTKLFHFHPKILCCLSFKVSTYLESFSSHFVFFLNWRFTCHSVLHIWLYITNGTRFFEIWRLLRLGFGCKNTTSICACSSVLTTLRISWYDAHFSSLFFPNPF